VDNRQKHTATPSSALGSFSSLAREGEWGSRNNLADADTFSHRRDALREEIHRELSSNSSRFRMTMVIACDGLLHHQNCRLSEGGGGRERRPTRTYRAGSAE
jgi:hypothetical protein